MSFLVFAAVLLSALLHAVWNAYAKHCPDKLSYFVVMSVVDGLAGIIIALCFWTIPDTFMQALPFLLGTAIFHVFYRFLLGTCYEDGDLGFVYPICRGSAPFMVFIFSLILLQEVPGIFQMGGIFFISVGILSFGFRRTHHSYKIYALALLTGLSIAGYCFFGGLAARTMDSALLAIAYVSIIDAPAYIALAFLHDKKRILENIANGWKIAAFGGFIAFVGYLIGTWAMIHADMSAVTALRSTSVLFAMLIGVFYLKEKMNLQRIASAVLIVCGIALVKF